MISLYDTNINDFLIWCKNRFYNLFNLIFKVGFAVEKMSKRLEVNDQKTKVRRIEILPEHDETGKRSPSLLFCNTTSTWRKKQVLLYTFPDDSDEVFKSHITLW